ncbi:amino acid permease-domain-containing protein [Lasiosphaeris hirsuta]|uniref:Amino acid permease-domain-containing protein n=1 Tax=Lasiosphaeris hirsuta TaxID=260670 RepID=A0AA39ZS63_9PEZI|nr:amino acid permease-domain-containing protein [Lasiosphaeris hirsuta]
MASQTETAIGPIDTAEHGRIVRTTEVRNAPDRRKRVELEELCAADRALVEQFGYMPVFKREFGYLSTSSFALSITGLFASTTITFTYPLAAGGAASVVWCWLIAGAGYRCIAFSVAELASAYPTCGGLYYTVSRLTPKEWASLVSWVVGWINLLGQVAAAVSIGRDFTWYPSTNQTVGAMAALTVLNGFVNSLSTYWMSNMTKVYVIFHFAVLLSCAIALLAKTKNKHDAKYVFTHVEGSVGWFPVGWSFLFGFLSAAWTVTDYDATVHIAEEYVADL